MLSLPQSTFIVTPVGNSNDNFDYNKQNYKIDKPISFLKDALEVKDLNIDSVTVVDKSNVLDI